MKRGMLKISASALTLSLLMPIAAYAARSYGNADGTASMTASKWGNNYTAFSGTQKSYQGKAVYTQGRVRNAVGDTSWSRVSTNTSTLAAQTKQFNVVNTNYTFTKISSASLRLCTDIPLWPDSCGAGTTFPR